MANSRPTRRRRVKQLPSKMIAVWFGMHPRSRSGVDSVDGAAVVCSGIGSPGTYSISLRARWTMPPLYVPDATFTSTQRQTITKSTMDSNGIQAVGTRTVNTTPISLRVRVPELTYLNKHDGSAVGIVKARGTCRSDGPPRRAHPQAWRQPHPLPQRVRAQQPTPRSGHTGTSK